MSDRVDVRTLVDAVGLLAVVGSLVFVGLEMRHNTAATRSATMQQSFDGMTESALNVMNNERLRELLVEVKADPSWLELNDGSADYLLLEQFTLNRLNLWENSHFHLGNGTLDPTFWLGIEGWIQGLANDPLNTHFWGSMRLNYNPSFRHYMDSTFAARTAGDSN